MTEKRCGNRGYVMREGKVEGGREGASTPDRSSAAMSALEVLTRHQNYGYTIVRGKGPFADAELVGGCTGCDWHGSLLAHAQHQLDALNTAGYAVVLLPEPDSERYEGDEHEPADRPSWQVDMYEVAVWYPGEVQINYDGTECEPLDTAVARDFAGALLAAVERADQQYLGGEDQ